jgi:hypothetical protein
MQRKTVILGILAADKSFSSFEHSGSHALRSCLIVSLCCAIRARNLEACSFPTANGVRPSWRSRGCIQPILLLVPMLHNLA